jgi:hypothetical protein
VPVSFKIDSIPTGYANIPNNCVVFEEMTGVTDKEIPRHLRKE